MEYTLQDVLDALQEIKETQERKVEDLTNIISNNVIHAIKTSSSAEDIRIKNEMLLQRLIKEVKQIQPENYPIPRTSDLHTEVFREMEDEIQDMQEMLKKLEKRLNNIQEDIK